jgi:CheY-like chemotaxis protein
MELIVKEALKLLRSTLPTTIDMRENIWSKSVILSDPTQLHQIVMNLCTNAAHAMREKGGILETTLTDVMLDSDFVSTHPDIHPGAYQKLTVSDTGHGIKLEVMNQIFDPFFTTKGVDEGTGLGLSVVYGIVKDCGGTITVYSEPDKGTTFNLYFPILKGTAEEKTSEYTIIPTGTERILLVDDEKPIVNIITKILSSLGYDVQSRTSSIEALELFKAMPKKFDLVITDMTLPQMSGDALAQELMKIRPDLPVILCTGFSENITKEKAETMGIKVFLMKPLLKEEMAHAIRRVLDEAKGSAY